MADVEDIRREMNYGLVKVRLTAETQEGDACGCVWMRVGVCAGVGIGRWVGVGVGVEYGRV